MEKLIEIINLNFNNVFDKLYLDINKNDFLIVIGKNNSGKTILANIIAGVIHTYDNILIESQLINYYDRTNIYFSSNNNYGHILIKDLLADYDNKEITRLFKLIKKKDMLDKYCDCLSSGEKQILNIIITILLHKKIIILDDNLNMIDKATKIKLIKELKKLCDNKISTIIYFTSDIEDLTYTNIVALINNKKIETINKKELLENEKLLLNINQHLPFLADLCNKLKYYNLIDKMITNENKLVNEIWK